MKEQIISLINTVNNNWEERKESIWEITTRRLTIVYLAEHRPDHKSLNGVYDCYRWINEIVNIEPESQGLDFKYKTFFRNSNPHTVIQIISSEFNFWYKIHSF